MNIHCAVVDQQLFQFHLSDHLISRFTATHAAAD